MKAMTLEKIVQIVLYERVPEWDWGSGSLVDRCMPFYLYNHISIVEVGENKYYRGDEVSQMIVNLYKPYSLTR